MIGQNANSMYRWYVLALAILVYTFVAGVSRFCMPVLFKEISLDLDLSLVAIGAVWGMDPLAGIFVSLPGGLIVDRFGTKRTMIVICFLAGIFGALRGLSTNFGTLAVSMFLFGLISTTMPIIVPKVTAVWFEDRELGISNALYNVVWPIGGMASSMLSATLLSPLLGGWRYVLILYGIPCVLLGLLWVFTKSEKNKNAISVNHIKTAAFHHALLKVFPIKELWILGLIVFAFIGSTMGLTGYLPLYLRETGWSPVFADSAITVLTGISCIGAVPVILLSDKLGSRKIVLFLSIITMTVTLGLLPLISGPIIYVLLILNGLTRTGVFALINVIIFEMKKVDNAYSGTAVGLVATFAMLGGFISPPLGNSMGTFGLGMPFFFWTFLSILTLPLFLLFKEENRRGFNRIF